MNIIGATTINPILFYSGKISGYFTWLMLIGYRLNLVPCSASQRDELHILSTAIMAVGLMIVILSLVHLGKSTRLGLPLEDTELKLNGLYGLSRNPMYFGFDLLTLASMLYCMNNYLLVLGIYSMVVYHLIILGEEKFLQERFGEVYTHYKKRVRRYI